MFWFNTTILLKQGKHFIIIILLLLMFFAGISLHILPFISHTHYHECADISIICFVFHFAAFIMLKAFLLALACLYMTSLVQVSGHWYGHYGFGWPYGYGGSFGWPIGIASPFGFGGGFGGIFGGGFGMGIGGGIFG